mgnify:CR=1 FL=1|tara:strand:- start:39997 stop:40374 length:378 start_codon:yes stop_codon:yes gene_type:complete
MKKLHIHVGVDDLSQSMAFYTSLFGEKPIKIKDDYAKWMLEDPCVNFAISTQVKQKGVNHLGIQVTDAAELDQVRQQLSDANISTHKDGDTTCCYARSKKSWVADPDGVAWEAYYTMEDVQTFSE